MTISKDLWLDNQDIIFEILNHPFIKGVYNGNLDLKCFTFYLEQDAFFLQAFARSYSIAAARTNTWEDFVLFHSLANETLKELEIHQNYAQKWGISLQDTEVAPTTHRYVDFLLSTAWGKDLGKTAVAMTPCIRLYVFLGKELTSRGLLSHQYSEWIRNYNSPELDKYAQKLEALVDHYVTDKDLAQSTYYYALLCEQDFFDAAYNAKQTQK